MAYEPSEQIKEQIAKEYQNRKIDYPLTEAEAYIKADICLQLPTIKKALALYENRPQWQDKPDREGWWWEDLETDQEGFHPYKIIRVTRVWGELRVATSFLPTIDDYIGLYGETAKTKFLYIPEPEPYKGKD
jgi:hypothetical protein